MRWCDFKYPCPYQKDAPDWTLEVFFLTLKQITLKRIAHQKRHRSHITVNWTIRDYYNLRYKVISDQMRYIEFTEPYKWGIISRAEVDAASERGRRKPGAAERLNDRYETNSPSEEVSGEADQSDEADARSRHPVGWALERCRSGAWNGTQRGRRSRRGDCAGRSGADGDEGRAVGHRVRCSDSWATNGPHRASSWGGAEDGRRGASAEYDSWDGRVGRDDGGRGDGGWGRNDRICRGARAGVADCQGGGLRVVTWLANAKRPTGPAMLRKLPSLLLWRCGSCRWWTGRWPRNNRWSGCWPPLWSRSW